MTFGAFDKTAVVNTCGSVISVSLFDGDDITKTIIIDSRAEATRAALIAGFWSDVSYRKILTEICERYNRL